MALAVADNLKIMKDNLYDVECLSQKIVIKSVTMSHLSYIDERNFPSNYNKVVESLGPDDSPEIGKKIHR